MVTEVITSIKAYLYERAVSPLAGSLIVSWCAWNYKFLLLWVSGMEFPEKVAYIDVLYSGAYEVWFQGVILPLITACLYLFVFPIPAEKVYKHSLAKQKILVDLKNEIEDNQLLTVEKSRAILRQISEIQRESDRLLEHRDRAIETRDAEIESLREQLATAQKGWDDSINDDNVSFRKWKETVSQGREIKGVPLETSTSSESELVEPIEPTSSVQGEDVEVNASDFDAYRSTFPKSTNQELYWIKTILESLLLKDRTQADFELEEGQFNSLMYQLVLKNLVTQALPNGRHRITDIGRNFLRDITE